MTDKKRKTIALGCLILASVIALATITGFVFGCLKIGGFKVFAQTDYGISNKGVTVEDIESDYAQKIAALPAGDFDNLYVMNNMDNEVVKVPLTNGIKEGSKLSYIFIENENKGDLFNTAFNSFTHYAYGVPEYVTIKDIAMGLKQVNHTSASWQVGYYDNYWGQLFNVIQHLETSYKPSWEVGPDSGMLFLTANYVKHGNILYTKSNLAHIEETYNGWFSTLSTDKTTPKVPTCAEDLRQTETAYVYLAYKPRTYSIKFEWLDSGVWATNQQYLEWNTVINEVPEPQHQEHAQFIGWDRQPNRVEDNQVYKAQYLFDKYKIILKENDGSLIGIREYDWYTSLTNISAPNKINCQFLGWSLAPNAGLINTGKDLTVGQQVELYAQYKYIPPAVEKPNSAKFNIFGIFKKIYVQWPAKIKAITVGKLAKFPLGSILIYPYWFIVIVATVVVGLFIYRLIKRLVCAIKKTRNKRSV